MATAPLRRCFGNFGPHGFRRDFFRRVAERNEITAGAHLTNKCYDRLVVSGAGTCRAIEILKPPYGKRPNDANKRMWTDYFFVTATLWVE